jgi:two-component system, NarL family, sensor histidine kinase DevS
LVEDRAQIAEDLRNRVVHRLFSHGLTLQGIAARVARPELRQVIEGQIAEVDAIIRDIRAAVFSLNPSPPAPQESVEPARERAVSGRRGG